MNTELDTLRQRIEQIDEMHKQGLLSEALYLETRQNLEREVVNQVLSAPAGASAAPPAPAATGARPSARIWALVAGFVVVLGGAGYWWAGSPQRLARGADAPPMATGAGQSDAQAPHALGNEQMQSMVDALAERLKTQPADAEGWGMLARSYATLGRHREAVPAYAKALALSPKDATLMADYADALALQQDRKLAGAPMDMVRRALAADPRQPKALLLAGTEAFDRRDYTAARQYWQQVIDTGAPDSALVKQARAGIEDVAQLTGAPATTSAGAAPTQGKAAPGARITGTVSLAASLAGKVRPDDTVFVFARPVEGPRMPLAMLRRQVKDLPLQFSLDDSQSMSPQARLSGVSEAELVVRVSRSGQALPQPGDLEGSLPKVKVGAQDLKLVIDRAVN